MISGSVPCPKPRELSMQIRELNEHTAEGKKIVAARVEWENSLRPSKEIFFEVDEENSDALTVNPHAFVVACVVPALLRGEKRIAITVPIEKELIHGIRVIMRTLRFWHPDLFPHEIPDIDAPTTSGAVTPSNNNRSAMF